MSEQNTYLVSIRTSTLAEQEILLGIISQFEIVAAVQDNDQLKIYHESKELLQKIVEGISFLPFITEGDIHLESIANKNWNQEWEQSFDPIQVDDFCNIRADFHKRVSKGIDIVINPELAFGTGHHETTYMMIEQMRRLDFSNKSVFDFGCGTAILAILAERLGANKILAIDNDEQSIKCARECIYLNQSRNISLLTATLSDVEPSSGFDIILANINRNVLLECAERIIEFLNPGGVLILSGILIEDEKLLTETYENNNLTHRLTIYRGEWISIRLDKV